MQSFYKTKLVVEIEVSTQFGPTDAVNMVKHLTNVPAVLSVTVSKLETDYLPQNEKEENFKTIRSVPIKIK